MVFLVKKTRLQCDYKGGMKVGSVVHTCVCVKGHPFLGASTSRVMGSFHSSIYVAS